MSQRIAFFSTKEEIEEFFQFDSGKESIFEPHYNLAPAQSIPVIYRKGKQKVINRVRWGLEDPKDQNEGNRHTVGKQEAAEGLKSGEFQRCVIPISGYFKWKTAGKRKEFPFFVRMLDEPVMAIAGVALSDGKNGDKPDKCAMIETDANALIQPLDEKMPLQLNRDLSRQWLGDTDPEEVLMDAGELYLLTDLTVLRVSKKVNDLSQNSPDLIQPLPK